MFYLFISCPALFDLMKAIDQLLSTVKDLPATPQILPKLLEVLQNEDSDIEQAGDLISFEPALTARLLRYCNSAAFAGAEPVASVSEAIARMGFHSIYLLVTTACVSKAFTLPAGSGLDAGQLWKHGLLAAFGAKFVAEATGRDSNMLCTAGLLHDVGRVVLAKTKGAEYGRLLARAEFEQVSASTLEKSAYGFSHAEVSACLMQNWRFPARLTKSARYHHLPGEAGDEQIDAACVSIGNVLAHTLDFPQTNHFIPTTELDKAMGLLNFTSQDMTDYVERMKQNWDLVNSLLQS
jgi:HD-like signal output (HDOD) protein